MRLLARMLKEIADWFDRRWPDPVAVGELQVRLEAVEAQFHRLTVQLADVRVQMAKVKMMVGLNSITEVTPTEL